MVAIVVTLAGLVLTASPSETQAVDTESVALTGATVQSFDPEASSGPGTLSPTADEDSTGGALGPVVSGTGTQIDPGTCGLLAGDQEPEARPPSFTINVEQDRQFGYATTLSLLDVRAHGCGDLATATVDWGGDWDAPDATVRRVLRPDLNYTSITFAPHRYLVRPVPVSHRITVRVTDNAGRNTVTDTVVATAPIFDVTVKPIKFTTGSNWCDIYAGKGDFEFSYWGIGPRRTERFDLWSSASHTMLQDGVTAYGIGAWEGRRLYYDWDELDSVWQGLIPGDGDEIGPAPRSILLVGAPGARTEYRYELDPGDDNCSAGVSVTVTTVRRAD